MTLLPAYGRDYKSARAALTDWKEGKDFKIATTGQYCSVRDNIPDVWIRYDQQRRIVCADIGQN
jgi:hypothetical protein